MVKKSLKRINAVCERPPRRSRQNVDLCPHICSPVLFVQHFFARNHDQTEKKSYGKEVRTVVSQNKVFSVLFTIILLCTLKLRM